MFKSIIAICVVCLTMSALIVGSTYAKAHTDTPFNVPDAAINSATSVRRERVIRRKERRKAARLIDKLVRQHVRHIQRVEKITSVPQGARPESKKKAMFHPTQPLTLNFIARSIELILPSKYVRSGPQSIIVGDTSVGDGVSLSTLKKLLVANYDADTYGREVIENMIHLVGVEPNLGRARKARSQGIKVLASTLEETKRVLNVLDMAFCNPPYDKDDATGGRLETEHLMMTLQFLKDNGLFVLIIKRSILQHVAQIIATYGKNIAISNYAPEEEADFDQIVVWFHKKKIKMVEAEGTDEVALEQMVRFARREIEREDIEDIFTPYTLGAIDPNHKVLLFSRDAAINPRTGKETEPFAFTKQISMRYADTVASAYSDDGIIGRNRVEQDAEAFRRGRTQEHRGIREDQLAMILGAGVGEYLPALYRDPRSGDIFHGILRVTSQDGERVVSEDEKLGIAKIRRVQELVSMVFNADAQEFIPLAHEPSTPVSINQREFLTDSWNARVVQELVKGSLRRTFEPPSLEHLLAAKAPNPKRLLSSNFKMRLMYNQHVSAMNAAELLTQGRPAFINAEQGSGKSKTYMGAMELANKSSILMVLPEQLTAVLARELAETLSRVTVISLDTITLNSLRMKRDTPLPHEWEDIIRKSYPDDEWGGKRYGVKMRWDDDDKGVLQVDFTDAIDGPDLKAFEAFSANHLGKPRVTGINGVYRLEHDYNPVSQETVREILKLLPEGSAGFVEHTESMRFTVPSGAPRVLLNKVAKSIAGSKAQSITFTQFWVGRSRPVSRDPVVYQLEAARKAASEYYTSPENPVYVLAPFTMLTHNHTKVSSLQTWRAIEQRTTERNQTLSGEEMSTSQLIPSMVNTETSRPMSVVSEMSTPRQILGLKEMTKAYRAKLRSRTALACPECLEMLREKKKGIPLLTRPGAKGHPMLTGSMASGNLIQGNGIAPFSADYSTFLEKVAITRAANRCDACDAPLGASYWQKVERSKGRAVVRHNDKLAAIEYLTSNKMKDVFDCVIFDEAHKVKGMDSARGIAAGKLFDSCKSVLMGTATFNNGFAESMFRPFRIIPTFREEYDIDEAARFQDDYGFSEFIRETSTENDVNSATSNRKTASQREKKMPGIKGEFLKWLLPYTVSMKLHDVKEMCNLDEFLIAIDPEDELLELYQKLMKQLADICDTAEFMDDNTTVARAVSDMRNLGITLLNAPYRGIDKCYPRVGVEEEYGGAENLPDPDSLNAEEYETLYYPRVHIAPSFLDRLTKKEKRLLDLFDDALIEDPESKFLSFLWYTGELNYVDTDDEHNLISRLVRLGGAEVGMNYLGDNVPTANRTAHIEDMVANDTQAVFVNSKRVAEGVTLNMMNHIVFFETPVEPSIKSQAARRSYRLNQNKDIKVYVMYYSNTVQELEMSLLQNKEGVDRIVSGEMPAVDEMNRDIVNPDDALLMMVRQQVINGKAELPEHLRAKQNEDTSLLLTQRSHFIGDEEYVHRMRGVSLEDWVAVEYAHLRNYMEEPYQHMSWLGYTPPMSILELPPVESPVVIDTIIDAIATDEATVSVEQEDLFEPVLGTLVLPKPEKLTSSSRVDTWFDTFNGVEQIAPVEDEDPVIEIKDAAEAVTDAWANAFFGGDTEAMATTPAKPKRRKRRSKEEQIAMDIKILEQWKSLVP